MAMIVDTNTPATVRFDLAAALIRFFDALAAGQAAASDFERRRVAHDGILPADQAVQAIHARHFG